MHSRPPASAYAAAVGMTVAFGLSFVATKYALRGFEPLLLALLRFVLAGGILWVVWRFRRGPQRVSRGELGRLAVLGFVSLTVYFRFENLGIARTSASEAAILIATIPLFVVILNTFTLREHNTARQWAGIALSFAGIAALVLLGGGGAGGGSLTGNLLVLAASLSAGVYSILARRLLVSRPALFVTTFQNLFGALFMLPLALAEQHVGAGDGHDGRQVDEHGHLARGDEAERVVEQQVGRDGTHDREEQQPAGGARRGVSHAHERRLGEREREHEQRPEEVLEGRHEQRGAAHQQAPGEDAVHAGRQRGGARGRAIPH